MRFGSCFSGIGGFDLGLEAAGMVPVWQIELEEYGRAILSRHWPNVARYANILDVPSLDPVDIICGGFPCQDISVAGKQEGLNGDKSRLWFEMLRIVQAVRPRWVLVENSPALRTRGGDEVLGGLEALGYACWPLVVGARHVGAGHRRDRVWIVGRLDNSVLKRSQGQAGGLSAGGNPSQCASDLADAGILGLAGLGQEGPRLAADVRSNGDLAHSGESGQQRERFERILDPNWAPHWRDSDGRDCSLEHPEGTRLEGRRKRLPRRWPASPVEPQHSWEPPRTVEQPVGRGINGISRRLAERRRQRELEALGAAVVPQVAEALGRAIIRVDRAERLLATALTNDLDDIR